MSVVYASPHLLSDILSQVREMPQIADTTSKILKSYASGMMFSAAEWDQRATRVTKAADDALSLERNRWHNQCQATSRAPINASCLAASGIFVGAVPNLIAKFVGADWLLLSLFKLR